jgi:hypothetical protein
MWERCRVPCKAMVRGVHCQTSEPPLVEVSRVVGGSFDDAPGGERE